MESQETPSSKSSNYLSQILLIAVPLVSAPFAFVVGREYGNPGSLGLEYLLIGFLALEFFILFLFNQEFFEIKPIFDGEEPVLEVVMLSLTCLNCDKKFETERREEGVEVYCPHCETSSVV